MMTELHAWTPRATLVSSCRLLEGDLANFISYDINARVIGIIPNECNHQNLQEHFIRTKRSKYY